MKSIELKGSFDGLFIKSFKLCNLSGFHFCILPLMFTGELSSPDRRSYSAGKNEKFSKEMWFGLNYFQGQTLTRPDWIRGRATECAKPKL
jgi:hypothetical protein